MPYIRYAVQNGAWSSGSTWDSGVLPLDGDDIYADGKTITINQNINILRLTNFPSPSRLPGNAIPLMTSNTTPEGAVSASSFQSTNFPWRAFDNSTSTFWQSNTINSASIAYQFPSGKIIKQYAFLSYSVSNIFSPRNWFFEGSNDNITYTIIETVTGFTTATNTWYVRNVSSNTTSYTWYRMRIEAVQTIGNTHVIPQLNMTELTSSAYSTGNSGSFISGGDIQISASAQVADGFFGIHPQTGTNTVSFFTVTGSHQVGITGSVAAPQGGTFATSRYGVNITNGGTLGVIGDVYGGFASGGSSGVVGIFLTSGNVFITGSLRVNGNGGNTVSPPLYITNGTASISGSLFSATNTSPITLAAGTAQVNVIATPIINGNSTSNMQIGGTNSGTLNYTGPVIGNNNAGISIAGTMTVNISGNISTVGAASGFTTSGTGTVNINGSITSGPAAPGLQSTSTAIIRIAGPLISQNNFNAVYAQRIQFISSSTPTYTLQTDTFPKDITFYDVSYTASLPTQTNVRSGSLYGGTNEFSGSMVVPSTGSVRYGVPVDNTTGSAILTPQDILTYAVSSLTGSNSIGARLKNISTIQTTAATIAAFKGK
jgi:hypothetical protein